MPLIIVGRHDLKVMSSYIFVILLVNEKQLNLLSYA